MNQGGWGAFVKFQVQREKREFEDKVWKGIGALVMGLGGLAARCVRRITV